ncbi:phage holin family protein [Solicola sp. PLA-1-18]|jgi:hypothetical protein|uniref:phage holin family protein n=1 Tax=Solicola sp. PLA-1-18 TaxID=3380532 RepID=UPI003B7E206B
MTTPPTSDASVGQLLGQLSEQTSRLVRDEMQLAKIEIRDTVRHAGLGAGLFSAAGVLALYGVGALVATAIIALALLVDLWLAALIVTVVLFAGAGLAALVGKKQVGQVSVTPERAVENVKRDVAEVKGDRS